MINMSENSILVSSNSPETFFNKKINARRKKEKMKTTKRILSLFLCMVMILGMIPMIASAEGETYTYEKVTTAPTDWTGEYLIVYEAGNNKAYVMNEVIYGRIDIAGNPKTTWNVYDYNFT